MRAGTISWHDFTSEMNNRFKKADWTSTDWIEEERNKSDSRGVK